MPVLSTGDLAQAFLAQPESGTTMSLHAGTSGYVRETGARAILI